MAYAPEVRVPIRAEVELDIKGVRQIGVARPGDILVVTTERFITDQEFHEMEGRLRELFPELRFLLLDGALEVTIIREGQADVDGEAGQEAARYGGDTASDSRPEPPVLPDVVWSEVGGPGQETSPEGSDQV